MREPVSPYLTTSLSSLISDTTSVWARVQMASSGRMLRREGRGSGTQGAVNGCA